MGALLRHVQLAAHLPNVGEAQFLDKCPLLKIMPDPESVGRVPQAGFLGPCLHLHCQSLFFPSAHFYTPYSAMPTLANSGKHPPPPSSGKATAKEPLLTEDLQASRSGAPCALSIMHLAKVSSSMSPCGHQELE